MGRHEISSKEVIELFCVVFGLIVVAALCSWFLVTQTNKASLEALQHPVLIIEDRNHRKVTLKQQPTESYPGPVKVQWSNDDIRLIIPEQNADAEHLGEQFFRSGENDFTLKGEEYTFTFVDGREDRTPNRVSWKIKVDP